MDDAAYWERVRETTDALKLATAAMRTPSPAKSLAAIQPELLAVVDRNERFLRIYEGPRDTTSLREITIKLKAQAKAPTDQYRTFTERVGDAADDLPTLGLSAMGLFALVLVLVFLLSNRK